jgi:hypothetical protein
MTLYYSRFRKIQWQTKAVYNAVLRVKNEATCLSQEHFGNSTISK